MNKDNAHLYLPLVQALADGKTIEHCYNGVWESLPEYDFDCYPEYYRIKPEPVVVDAWITRHEDGCICSITTTNMDDFGWQKAKITVTSL